MGSSPKKVLFSCIAISLLIHALFLVFLQTHSLWFYSRVESQKTIDETWTHLLDNTPRDQILKEAFSSLSSVTGSPCQPMQETVSQQFSPSVMALQTPSLPPLSMQAPPIDELLSQASSLFPIRSFHLPAMKNFSFFVDIPKDLIIPSTQPLPVAPMISLRAERIGTPHLESASRTSTAVPPESMLDFTLPSPPSISHPEEIAPPRSTPIIPLPKLPHLPSLVDLSTINLSDAFEAELTFLPRPEGPGYIFAITLVPKADLHLPKIHQRVTFLIDRSNSIQKERLVATKYAVLRALEELDPEDSFNLIVFDNKTEKLFPSLVSPTADAIAKAEAFLDKTNLGSFFSTSELYKPLLLTIPSRVQEDESYCAILLTDGESLSKKHNQLSLLQEWTLHNQGRVSLYAVSMESDSNLDTLGTLCSLNRGHLIQSTTQRGLKRQLLKLTKTIHAPLAKNLSPKAISRSPNTRIEIHPKPSIAPHLYLDQPYVLLGTTETLDDFVIFIQGKLKDKWLNIKKPISFLHAKKGGHTLKAAYHSFEKFSAATPQDLH